jgi:hypothetical protein
VLSVPVCAFLCLFVPFCACLCSFVPILCSFCVQIRNSIFVPFLCHACALLCSFVPIHVEPIYIHKTVLILCLFCAIFVLFLCSPFNDTKSCACFVPGTRIAQNDLCLLCAYFVPFCAYFVLGTKLAQTGMTKFYA